MPTNDQPWNGGEGSQMDKENGQNSEHQGARQRVGQIGANARGVVDDSRTLISDGLATVTDRMHSNPYQTMLIAAGVGYLLGGGLFSSLTVRLLRTGIRMAAMPMVRNELMNLAPYQPQKRGIA